MENNDIAWLAGLLEGEGCFKLDLRKNDTRRPRICVQLAMSDPDVVNRAAELMGTTVHFEINKREDKYKRMFRTRAYGAKAERIMRLVLPYMGERRSAKIEECLATPNLSHTERNIT